ncbi:MAG: RluA family pseudouridine synthase [Bacillota bacterium]|nr:RluA family pseudouridine synthase [Bacillota bacterium]
MKSIVIKENDSHQRLDKFLFKYLGSIPKGLLFKYLRTGHIKVNRKKKDGNYILALNDVIDLYISDEFIPDTKPKENIQFKRGPLDIVFENDDILVVNKPANLPSQPDASSKDSLTDYIKAYLYDSGSYDPESENSFSPAICNRLDVNTSGLVIAAKNAESLRILNEKIRNKEIRKIYKCLVIGCPENRCGYLDNYILKDKALNKSKILEQNVPGALSAKTNYKVLVPGKTSLLEVEILTGRSHQIRAHMAYIGHPILGDAKYGGGSGTQKLCAYKLIFDFKEDASRLNYLKGFKIEIKPDFDIRKEI